MSSLVLMLFGKLNIKSKLTIVNSFLILLILFSFSCDKNPVDADKVHLDISGGWPSIKIDGYHRYQEPEGGYTTYDYKYDACSRPVEWKVDYEKDDKSNIVTAHFHSIRYNASNDIQGYKVTVFGKTFSWP
ncbi:MAG: hypothetical protein GF353_05565 [Candidatus Lokiarchaeota archaeon]|nr:hypothetical protein [Candidatus Lokiarchaeota archaeon]